MFLFKISSKGPRSLLKEALSILATIISVVAYILAALGSFLSKANSPK